MDGSAMDGYRIDPAGMETQARSWGTLQTLFDGTSMEPRSGFSFGRITYREPHHSGVHADHELIYVLEGRGAARIAGRQVRFQAGQVLVIPAGTDHGISRVDQGPVRAILVHFI